MKDIVYHLLQEPTLDHFREFLKNETGEHNAIDFKQEWINDTKLAKLMLSLANYGGGIVVFGVHENTDKTFSCDGLKELQAKEQISSRIRPYISTNLKYSIYDFSYQASEYEALNGKHFQILVVEDTPEFLPFISRKDGDEIKSSAIYIRRGTSNEQITEDELSKLLERRMKHIFPATGKPLTLDEHLDQLETLYKKINPTITKINEQRNQVDIICEHITKNLFKNMFGKFVDYETIPNPLYPEESCEEFISTLIDKKKRKIERVLDLQ